MYVIQAFIGRPEDLITITGLGNGFANIGQGLILVPVNNDFRTKYDFENLGLLEHCGRSFLEKLGTHGRHCRNFLEKINSLIASTAQNGKVAYIEAEFFGGDGMQASIMFNQGRAESRPLISRKAIGRALRFLGASATNFVDEFEAVGLDQHRRTEDWLGKKG